MAANCPNKSWPAYKEMVEKHGESLAYDAFRFNGYKMFNSLAEGEMLIAKKKTFDNKYTTDIRKRLVEVLKYQLGKYEGRTSAASREYVAQITEIIDEINKNNDLVGIIRMLEISNEKSNSVFQKIVELQQAHPNFDNLSQEEVARVAEMLQEIRTFMSTYDILDEIESTLPDDSPVMKLLDNLRKNRKNIVVRYKEMHQEVIAAWLSSQVERVNKSLSGSDKDKYYLTKQRIKELLDTAVADIGTFEKWLGAQANSKDPLTGLIAARIKEESFKVHDENVEVTQNLLELYKAGGGSNNPEEYNKKYMRDALNWEFIHQKDKDGKFMYDKDGKAVGEWGYVKRKAIITEFEEDRYAKDLMEFTKSLPPSTSEEGIQRRLQMLRDWRKANTQLRQDPQALIAQKKATLTPLEFDRWFADNTVRVTMKGYANGMNNMDYHDPATIHSMSKDGSSFIIYKDVSEFYRPADKYRNAKFTQLVATDPYFKALHDAYQVANNRVHHKKRLKYGIIPQKMKKGYDKYIIGNGETVWTNIKDDFRHASNVETYDTVYGYQSPEGKDENQIPIYFTDMLDEKELSLDLLESTLDYFQMANNYNSMSKIEPFVEMVYDAVQGNAVVKIEPRKIQTLTPDGVVKKDKRSGRALQARTQNVNEALVEFLDKVVYGEYEIPKVVNFGDKQISMNKLTNGVVKWTSLNGLAANVNSFFNNTLMGNFTMAIEAIGGKNFSLKEFFSAEGMFLKEIGSLMNDTAQGYPTSKLGKLMIKYDAIQGEFQDNMGNNISGNLAKRLFTTDTLFFLTKGAELQIQGTGMIAMMKKQKVKMKNGTEISLWEAYDEKGNLKKDVMWTKEDQFNFMQRLHALNKGMHGIYNKFDSPTLQRRFYGKLALIFRKWIYSGMVRRWGSEFHNIESGVIEHGYYNLFFTKLWHQLKNGRLDMLTGSNLNEREREARAKAMSELLVMASMFLLVAAVKGDDDDEPNEWLQNQMVLQARRLGGDFMFYLPINPMEPYRVLNNPSVSMAYYLKLVRFFKQLIVAPTEQYERKTSGYEKGDYKLEKRFDDVLPVYSQIMNALYPEEQLSAYNKTEL
jgi:hypothetical protein